MAEQYIEFLRGTLRELMELCSAEKASLFFFREPSGELVPDTIIPETQARTYKLGEGIVGMAAQERTPVFVADINADSRFKSNGFKRYRSVSFVSLPLIAGAKCLGVINLTDKKEGDFSGQEMKFAWTLAEYASVIAANMRLTQYLKEGGKLDEGTRGLVRKYASMGKLAAWVVHEINNPLDGVIRFTNILLSQAESSSVAREYLLEIHQGLNRIAATTRSLLTFSDRLKKKKRLKNYEAPEKLLERALMAAGVRENDAISVTGPVKGMKVLDMGLSEIFFSVIKQLKGEGANGKVGVSVGTEESLLMFTFKGEGEFNCTDRNYDIIRTYNGRLEVRGNVLRLGIPIKFATTCTA